MRNIRSSIATAIVVGALSATFAVVACTPYDPSLPADPFSCGSSDPKCPDGFTCVIDGSNGRALCQSGSSTTPIVDAPPPTTDGGGMFVCANDSSTEPNETPLTATPLVLAQNPFTLTQLAICPATDKDNYKVHLASAGTLDVKMTYDSGGAVLTLGIVSTQGAPIVSCPSSVAPTTCTISGNTVEAKYTGAMTGDYVIQVLGPGASGTNGGENNYQLVITTS
jgi:hypothetical protein